MNLGRLNEAQRKAMAERTGLEPATPGVTGRYSNQLNYRSIALFGLAPEQEARIIRSGDWAVNEEP